MECHVNEGYSPVDEVTEQKKSYSLSNTPEGASDGDDDVHAAYDATNRGFVGREDELTSLPVGKTVSNNSDSCPVPTPVEKTPYRETILPQGYSKDSSPPPFSISASIASRAPLHGHLPAGEAPTPDSFLSLSSTVIDGEPTSSQLFAHHVVSSIILSTSLPPVSSNYLRCREKSKDGHVALNWSTPSDKDHVIEICKERGGDVPIAAESPEDAEEEDGNEEDATAEISLPEPEIIGARCRVDSTSDLEFRLVSKCGRRHVYSKLSLARRCLQYTRDIFTTMVDMEWKYHMVIWMASFCLSWVGFGILWWLAVVSIDDDRLPNGGNTTNDTDSTSLAVHPSYPSCLEKVQDITGAILFSIETQTTIGYGSRYIRSDCHPLAYVLFYIQILAGVCIAFLLSGVVFRKLSRPYGRASTILFSRYAVIHLDDSGTDYCLEFRMGDIRKSHIIGTSLWALMVKDRLTSEGERIPLCQYPLQLDTHSSTTDSFVFMPWPIIVSHRIDAESPLWTVSRRSLREERFEVIVMFEGVVESTGASTQFRTSYLPSEIVWGHRFASLPVHEKVGCDGHAPSLVDFGNFELTVPVEMDDRCAKDFAQNRKRLDATTERRNTGPTERVPRAVERMETGTSEDKYFEAIKYKNADPVDIGVAEMDHPFKMTFFSAEDLALQLHYRLRKKVKRRLSVKPRSTKGSSLGDYLTAKGQEVKKSYTF